MSDTVLSIPLCDIEIGERVGFFHADHAASLAASFAEIGQTTPIGVCRNPDGAALPWRLVSGRHRIDAAELLGWAEIEGIQIADASAGELLLLRLELSENDERRSYRPVERSMFIEQEYRVAEAREHGEFAGETKQQRGARVRWKTDENQSYNANRIMPVASDWRRNLAASMGFSVDTLERYRAIYRAIVEPFPELASALNFHRIGERFKHIHGIAKLERVDERRKVIETIIADPELDGLKSALIKCGSQLSNGNRTLIHDRATRSFHAGWGKMTLLQQEANAATLIKGAHLQVARKMYDALKKRADSEGWGDN